MFAAVVVSTAACGSDGGGTDSAEPIKVMTIASFESKGLSVPQVKTAMEVAVKGINDRGGINGRDVEALFCNDKFDPNEAAACAGRAVSEKVDAVVGNVTVFPAGILPVLESANIPLIAGAASGGAPELKSPISYPITAGAPGMTMAAGAVAVREGGPKVSIVHTEDAGGREGAENSETGVEALGGTAALTVMPANAPDASAVVAAALASKPDAVVVSTAPQEAARVVSGLRQANFDGAITGVASLFPPDAIKALGDQGEGVLVTGRTIPAASLEVSEIKRFNDEMTKFDESAIIDDLGLNAWTGMQLLATVLDDVDVESGKDVIAAMDSIEEPIELGAVPAYAGIQDPAPFPDLPRVSAFKASLSVITDGVLVSRGEFFDPLSG